jgi:hypothetical protein
VFAMLDEFTITMSAERVDEAIEKLNSYGYYNLYYDQPIEPYQEENGYGFQVLSDTVVDLKLFLENDETINVELVKEEIALILPEDTMAIAYQPPSHSLPTFGLLMSMHIFLHLNDCSLIWLGRIIFSKQKFKGG